MNHQEIYSREFDAVFFQLGVRAQQQIEDTITEAGSRLRQFSHHRLKGLSELRLRVRDYRVITNLMWRRISSQTLVLTIGN